MLEATALDRDYFPEDQMALTQGDGNDTSSSNTKMSNKDPKNMTAAEYTAWSSSQPKYGKHLRADMPDDDPKSMLLDSVLEGRTKGGLERSDHQ